MPKGGKENISKNLPGNLKSPHSLELHHFMVASVIDYTTIFYFFMSYRSGKENITPS